MLFIPGFYLNKLPFHSTETSVVNRTLDLANPDLTRGTCDHMKIPIEAEGNEENKLRLKLELEKHQQKAEKGYATL